jgi:hypothetical protein
MRCVFSLALSNRYNRGLIRRGITGGISAANTGVKSQKITNAEKYRCTDDVHARIKACLGPKVRRVADSLIRPRRISS